MPPTSETCRPHLLLFGASGTIGQAVASAAAREGWVVTPVARSAHPGSLVLDPFAPEFGPASFPVGSLFTSVCWAQGANLNDSLYDFDLDRHMEIFQANVTYILVTLRALLLGKLLAPSSRLCVVSSIWQNLARQNKLTYCVSKAALQGLVLSAAADLAKEGHLINAVLPGALDTPMTRRNLSPEQLDRLTAATQFNRLAGLDDVSSIILYLCSSLNTGITGQFINVDLGFSHVRIV